MPPFTAPRSPALPHSWQRLAAVALALTAGLAAPHDSAHAHVGAPPNTVDVMLRPGDSLGYGLESTIGIVLVDDGVNPQWICHESIVQSGDLLHPRYVRMADGALVGTVSLLGQSVEAGYTVFRSDDGCDWTPPPDLIDVQISILAGDPARPDRLIGASNNIGAGSTNSTWLSTDGGVSWTEGPLTQVDRVFRSVVFSGGAAQSAWMTTVFFDPLGAWIHHSLDGGETWQEWDVPLTLSPDFLMLHEVLAASPTNANEAWLRINGDDGDLLAHTVDGGETVEVVLELAGGLRDVAIDPDGVVWIAAEVEGLLRSDDGATFNPAGGELDPVGLQADGRGLYLGPTWPGGPWAMGLRPTGGGGFDSRVRFGDLEPITCPAGTSVGDRCDPFWDIIEPILAALEDGATEVDTGDDDDDDDTADDDDAADDDDDTADDDDDTADDDDTVRIPDGGVSGCCGGEAGTAAGGAEAPALGGALLLLGLGVGRRLRRSTDRNDRASSREP